MLPVYSLLLGVLACRHTCVDAAACVYVWHCDCVWTALVLEQSHLLTKTYEAGMNSLYRSIRCCGLANIWISDGIVAVRSLLPDSAQLHTVWLCQGVTCYQSEQHGATSGKLPSNTGNLHSLLLMVLAYIGPLPLCSISVAHHVAFLHPK